MEKQLLDLYKVAWKSARSGAYEPKCINALSQLRCFPITIGILTSIPSNINVFKQLRSLTKHPNNKIKDMTSLVLSTWRKKLLKQFAEHEKSAAERTNKYIQDGMPLKIILKLPKPKTNNPEADGDKTQNRTSMKADDHVPLPTAASKPMSSNNLTNNTQEQIIAQATPTLHKEAKDNANPGTVKALKVQNKKFKKVSHIQKPKILSPEEQIDIANKIQKPKLFSPKKEILESADDQKQQSKGASTPKSGNSLRNNIQQQISEALTMVFKEVKDDSVRYQIKTCDPDRIAASLESALFVKWGTSNSPCRAKYRSLLFNIKDPKNPDFRRKILLGEIKAEEVAEMSAAEMASDERQHEIQGIQARSLWKCLVGRNQEGTTDQFKCGKCGESKTTYHQMQTRSADEPMTTYVTCTVCENHWKFC